MGRLLSEKIHVAQKEYDCEACEWVTMGALQDLDVSFSDLRIIAEAKRNKWKIRKGDKYLKLVGVCDGRLITYRALPEVNRILNDYDVFDGADYC